MAGTDEGCGAGDMTYFEIETTGVADRLSVLVAAPERGHRCTAVVASRHRSCRRSGRSWRKSSNRGMHGSSGVDVGQQRRLVVVG
jgi:hypothetical protein